MSSRSTKQQLQHLAHTVQRLQDRIGDLNREMARADMQRADCQYQINRVKNIQTTVRNPASRGQ